MPDTYYGAMQKYTIYDFSSDPSYVRPFILCVEMSGIMAFLRTADTLRDLFQWDHTTACVVICRLIVNGSQDVEDEEYTITSEEDWVMEILKA